MNTILNVAAVIGWAIIVVAPIAMIAALLFGSVRRQLFYLVVAPLIMRLATSNIFFTLVDEGTAKAIKKGGALERVVAQWKGHELDLDGSVVNAPPIVRTPLLGGVTWIGIPPTFGVHRYDFFYEKWEEINNEMVLVPHPLKGIDYVVIRPDTFGILFKDAETKKSRITVNIKINVTLVVVNPEKALFKAPTNWWQKLKGRIVGLLVGLASSMTVDEILDKAVGHPKFVWDHINTMDPNFIPNLEAEQGVRILFEKIEIFDVSFTKEVQDLLDLERKQELAAEADLKKQGIEARTSSSATLGRLMESLSQVSGSDVATLQKELKKAMAEPDFEKRAKNVRAFWDSYDPDGRAWNLIQSERLGARVVLVGTPGGKSADPLTTLLATYETLKGGNLSAGASVPGKGSGTPPMPIPPFKP